MAILLQIHSEDHVSPVLKAISDAMLPLPNDLPPLPDPLVIVESRLGSHGLSVRMLPSPALLAWLAEVRKRGCSS